MRDVEITIQWPANQCHKENDEDITAAYDATDDADVVF